MWSLLLTVGITVSALQIGAAKQGTRQGKMVVMFNDGKWSYVCMNDVDGADALPREPRIPCRWIDVTKGNYETSVFNTDDIDEHSFQYVFGHKEGKNKHKRDNNNPHLARGHPATQQRKTRHKPKPNPDPNKTQTVPLNPCDPNPCPRDAKGNPVHCHVKPKEGTYECRLPKDMCAIDGELLKLNEKRVIGCKTCICLNPHMKEPFCINTHSCQFWTLDMIPPGCQLITPPGKCCQELDCSGSGAANVVSTTTVPTTPSIVTSTMAPKNPCDPNPCPKDPHGNPVHCHLKPKERTYECRIPKDTCIVDGWLLARDKKMVIGCKSCVCRLPHIKEPVCSSICPPWSPHMIPPGCQLITPPGKCCQELDCSGSGAANVVSTTTVPTTPSIVTSTMAPKNPCDPNPCPKDPHGNPVHCHLKPKERTYECRIPKGK
ncbi:uncharacterized protein LOC106152515 [Lingula anatina]|uniref:Uncharacterized protein LOC106152515 n=1 Tax=Lingula anatina TaxID=7574 RepID=A0A1S3H6G9_LINAN|nr:uncharacterized protein LOC106152515 [Lingula anatina]|eukprot:XP_013381577.1 uncharacterized protein LOC106152515 [Lingula anatina]